MTTIHTFAEELAYSHRQADQPWWEKVYRRAFVDFAAMVDLRPDGWHQRAGRDRAIVLHTGRTIYVDEKTRRDDYGDIVIEVWSQYPRIGEAPYLPCKGAKLGWVQEMKDCDWIAYAIEPTQICHLLPFLGLQAAWQAYGAAWRGNANAERDGYRWVRSKNPGYVTISIAVPKDDLYAAVRNAMTISWGGET